MKKYFLLPLVILACSSTLFAGTDFKSFKEVTLEDTNKFRDTELQLDIFFTQVFGPSTQGNTVNTGPGGGFGINAIFARYLGLGVSNFWFDNNGNGDYVLQGNLIARYPIESLSLAPYAIVGGGSGFGNTNVGFGTLGVGLEYRLTRSISSFVDGRWFYGAPNNFGNLQTGLRLVW